MEYMSSSYQCIRCVLHNIACTITKRMLIVIPVIAHFTAASAFYSHLRLMLVAWDTLIGIRHQTTYYIPCIGLFHRSIDDIAILFCFLLKCPNLNSLTWAQYHTTGHSNDINISDTTRCYDWDPDNIPSDLRFL